MDDSPLFGPVHCLSNGIRCPGVVGVLEEVEWWYRGRRGLEAEVSRCHSIDQLLKLWLLYIDLLFSCSFQEQLCKYLEFVLEFPDSSLCGSVTDILTCVWLNTSGPHWHSYLLSILLLSLNCQNFLSAVICRDPGTLQNGNRRVVNQQSGQFTCGSYIEYSCNNGFQIRGNNRVDCQANGQFSGALPTCEPICNLFFFYSWTIGGHQIWTLLSSYA